MEILFTKRNKFFSSGILIIMLYSILQGPYLFASSMQTMLAPLSSSHTQEVDFQHVLRELKDFWKSLSESSLPPSPPWLAHQEHQFFQDYLDTMKYENQRTQLNIFDPPSSDIILRVKHNEEDEGQVIVSLSKVYLQKLLSNNDQLSSSAKKKLLINILYALQTSSSSPGSFLMKENEQSIPLSNKISMTIQWLDSQGRTLLPDDHLLELHRDFEEKNRLGYQTSIGKVFKQEAEISAPDSPDLGTRYISYIDQYIGSLESRNQKLKLVFSESFKGKVFSSENALRFYQWLVLKVLATGYSYEEAWRMSLSWPLTLKYAFRFWHELDKQRERYQFAVSQGNWPWIFQTLLGIENFDKDEVFLYALEAWGSDSDKNLAIQASSLPSFVKNASTILYDLMIQASDVIFNKQSGPNIKVQKEFFSSAYWKDMSDNYGLIAQFFYEHLPIDMAPIFVVTLENALENEGILIQPHPYYQVDTPFARALYHTIEEGLFPEEEYFQLLLKDETQREGYLDPSRTIILPNDILLFMKGSRSGFLLSQVKDNLGPSQEEDKISEVEKKSPGSHLQVAYDASA